MLDASENGCGANPAILHSGKPMHLPWFRFYTEFATDPVMQSLAFEDQRHFVILLCLKGSGVMDRKISQQARNRIILRGLGLDQGAGEEVKRRLIDVDLIDKNWLPRGWEDRQFSSDTSTERVRKYRKTAGKTAFHQGTEEACGSAANLREAVPKYRENKETGNVAVTELERSETVPRAIAVDQIQIRSKLEAKDDHILKKQDVVVDSAKNALVDARPAGKKSNGKRETPACPHQAIIDLYHERLPMCPRVREWRRDRQRMLATRWREDPDRQDIKWWDGYFAYVAESRFLTGRGKLNGSSSKPFVASLEWLIRPSNFTKVYEGQYE